MAKLGQHTSATFTQASPARPARLLGGYRTQDQIKAPAPEISISESKDNGHTCSDPAPSEVAPGWPKEPKNLTPYGPLVETEDGAPLRFLYGGVEREDRKFTDVCTWSAVHCKALVIRSYVLPTVAFSATGEAAHRYGKKRDYWQPGRLPNIGDSLMLGSPQSHIFVLVLV